MLPKGFYTRSATVDDAQIVTDLLNAASMLEVGEKRNSVEEALQEWSEPGFELANSSLCVFAPDGTLAGYSEVWDDDPIPVKSFVLGRTHPDYHGHGVASHMLAWAEKVLERVFKKVPADSKVSLICAAHEGYQAATDFFQDQGMPCTRIFYRMAIDIEPDSIFPEPVWPEHLKLITYDQFENPRAVYHALDEAFKDHWGHVDAENPEESYDAWAHSLKDPKFDPTLWFLLMDGDEIAAVSLCESTADEQPDLGHIDNLGVRRPWRRNGYASMLLQHAFQEFQRRGQFRQVRLTVDADSLTGATRLYERAGMRILRENRVFERVMRDGVELAKV